MQYEQDHAEIAQGAQFVIEGWTVVGLALEWIGPITLVKVEG